MERLIEGSMLASVFSIERNAVRVRKASSKMKTILSLVTWAGLTGVAFAQGPVLIGGGATSPRPVLHSHTGSRTVVTRVIFRQEVNPLNPYASNALNCGSDEPHVSEVATVYSPVGRFGKWRYGCDNAFPPQRSACTMQSSVIFVGRSGGCRRSNSSYSFLHAR